MLGDGSQLLILVKKLRTVPYKSLLPKTTTDTQDERINKLIDIKRKIILITSKLNVEIHLVKLMNFSMEITFFIKVGKRINVR